MLKISKNIGFIGIILKLINESKAQEEKIDITNIIEKLNQLPRKEGSKKRFLYIRINIIDNKKINGVDPNGKK